MQESDLAEMFDEMTTDESEALLRDRLWTPKPDYVKHFSQTLYTDAELVDAFIATTDRWYIDNANALCGWQDEIRIELIRCLKENYEANSVHQLIYAEMKFSKEWTGPEGMFLEYHPERIAS